MLTSLKTDIPAANEMILLSFSIYGENYVLN